MVNRAESKRGVDTFTEENNVMSYLESRRTRSKMENKQLIQGIALMFVLAFIVATAILSGVLG